MKLAAFFVFVFLTSCISASKNQSPNEQAIQTEQPSNCARLPPGLMHLARGVDVTSLDLFPTDLNADHGFRGVLFDFTCKQKQKWILPSTDTPYDQPDQIMPITSMPAGEQSVEVHIHKSMSDLKQSLGGKVGLSVDLSFIGSFSASASYKQAKQNIMKTHSKMAQTSCSRSSSIIEFRDPADLNFSHKFKRAIASLKSPFLEHMDAYRQFFENFGTHYFVRGSFGGVLHRRVTIEESSSFHKDEKAIKTAMKASFMGMASAEVSVDVKTSKQQSEFDRNTDTKIHYFGGVSNLAKKDSIRNWWSSVDKNPWLFSGKLKPITDLLVVNATIQEEVKAYCLWRSIQAAMKDLEYSVELVGVPKAEEDLVALYEARAFYKYPELTVSKFKEQIERIAKVQKVLERAR